MWWVVIGLFALIVALIASGVIVEAVAGWTTTPASASPRR
jgi:hypothetical protein